MLVLSRRNGETVVVGGGGGLGRVVKIKVLQVATGRVKLGFEVDGDIPVHREEVWQRLCANGELQAGADYAKPT
jgi:carbon storage regulator